MSNKYRNHGLKFVRFGEELEFSGNTAEITENIVELIEKVQSCFGFITNYVTFKFRRMLASALP